MTGAITWGELSTIGTIVLAALGLAWWLWKLFDLARIRNDAQLKEHGDDLAQLRVEMIRDYVSKQSMREVEDRMASAVDRLGDRVDKMPDTIMERLKDLLAFWQHGRQP